jgi:hypothetical protein
LLPPGARLAAGWLAAGCWLLAAGCWLLAAWLVGRRGDRGGWGLPCRPGGTAPTSRASRWSSNTSSVWRWAWQRRGLHHAGVQRVCGKAGRVSGWRHGLACSRQSAARTQATLGCGPPGGPDGTCSAAQHASTAQHSSARHAAVP